MKRIRSPWVRKMSSQMSTKSLTRKYTLPKPPQEVIDTEDTLNLGNTESPLIWRIVPMDNATGHPNSPNLSLQSESLEETSENQGSGSSENGSVLERVLKILEELKNDSKQLKKEVKNLSEKIESLTRIQGNPKVQSAINEISLGEDFANLPLSSKCELETLDRELSKDPKEATLLARFLSRGIHNNISSLVSNVLRRLMKREVAVQFSLEGRQGKCKFSELNVYNVVVASIRMKYEDAPSSDVNKIISKILAGAVDWDGHRTRNKRKSQEEEDNFPPAVSMMKSNKKSRWRF